MYACTASVLAVSSPPAPGPAWLTAPRPACSARLAPHGSLRGARPARPAWPRMAHCAAPGLLGPPGPAWLTARRPECSARLAPHGSLRRARPARPAWPGTCHAARNPSPMPAALRLAPGGYYLPNACSAGAMCPKYSRPNSSVENPCGFLILRTLSPASVLVGYLLSTYCLPTYYVYLLSTYYCLHRHRLPLPTSPPAIAAVAMPPPSLPPPAPFGLVHCPRQAATVAGAGGSQLCTEICILRPTTCGRPA